MKTAAISKLKATLSEHIAWVKNGEEVLVTERGKPVARIVPVRQHMDKRTTDLVRRGVLRPGTGNLGVEINDLPICRVPEGVVLRIIDEEREDRC